jgi:hypothetical protein
MRITHRTASPISSENCGPRQMAQKRIAYGKLKARDGSSCGGCLTRTTHSFLMVPIGTISRLS